MDNLHYRLTFDLGLGGTKSFTTARKKILRLVELQSCLVAKCCKMRKICPLEVCKFGIYLYYAKKKLPFSARNTNIYKICKLQGAIFSVFYNQTLQFD